MTSRSQRLPHAPFEPDNDYTVTHGGTSPKRWRPFAEQLAADVVVACPWLARPGFADAVETWATVTAQARLVAEYVDEVGPLTAKGGPRACMALLDRLHARSSTLGARLGLDPEGLSKLLANFSAASGHGAEDVLAQLRAEGAATLAARPVPLGAGDDEAAS